MKVKSQLYRVMIAIVAAVFISTAVGCNRDNKENPDNKPTSGTLSPTGSYENEGKPTDVESTTSPPAITSDNTDAPSPSAADTSDSKDDRDDDDDDDIDDSPDIIPTVGDDDDPDDDPEADVLPVPDEPTPEDVLRTELWGETFLIWIPEFTEGVFTGTTAEKTMDYAIFTQAEEPEVLKYIEVLKESGFVHHVETVEDGSRIVYEACNGDNWWATVNFADGGLTIGSGYREDETSPSDIQDELWLTTSLGVLPAFESGVLTGSGTESNGTEFAVFEETTDEYIREYIEKLVAGGFKADTDNGDEDGFIWFTADDDKGNICDLTYYEGCVRLSVGK